MKITHLIYSAAMIAALALSAPAWAQTQGGNSYGGNSMGVRGPNPGGPEIPGTINGDLFGHSSSPAPYRASAAPMASANSGVTANQLNREELARLRQ